MKQSLQKIFQFSPIFVSLLASIGSNNPAAIAQETEKDLDTKSLFTSSSQRLTPYGKQIDLPGLRPQVIAISPNQRLMVTSGKTSKLIAIDPDSGEVLQQVDLPSNEQTEIPDVASANILKPDSKALASYTGLLFSPDGRWIYLSDVNGSVKVFQVGPDRKIAPSYTIPLPGANAPRRKQEIPSGLAIHGDGSKLYICGNLSNKLIEWDVSTNRITASWEVGVAPYDVVLHGNKAYVSNWGGRRPEPGNVTGPAGRGTQVRVDNQRYIANEGSITIIDKSSNTTKQVLVGLNPSDLEITPDGKYLVCANTNSDTLSILDLSRDEVIETISVKQSPSDLFGASPNALAFGPQGKRLYVAHGSQNAIGVIDFDAEDRGDTKLIGLLPTSWYPGALVFDEKQKSLCVANLKGLPITKVKKEKSEGFNSHQHYGSVSLMPIPDDSLLPAFSERVSRNMRYGAMKDAALPARPDQPARAIPQRIGEPSFIEHVVYVIKENRTYDQVLGDIDRGNGDPGLCIFGRELTPNQHKMAEEFVLLDNTYCCGILSADGHQWSTTAISTAYLEKSFGGFPRSYPDGMGEDEADALAYSPAGFLWDNAIAHRKTLRNYGEFMMPKVRWRDATKAGKPNYMACYRTWKKESDEVILESEPAIESIRPYSPTRYVGWGMEVPDQYRADFIIDELKQYEERGQFPNLVIICLPNDHTSGASPSFPTPASSIADNDLAFGRIVDALSHSQFWPKMAIFSIQDDPQAGWDHVSGYRTTSYCVSPYVKRGVTVSTRYNTTSLIRTMEQILGLPPMNQFDAGAVPMFDCFADTPNLEPFQSVPVTVPLDQLNPSKQAILDPAKRILAELSESMDFSQVDKAPEDLLNRVLWQTMRPKDPYPEWAIGSYADDDDDEEEIGK
jgi:YVTN family beta-propeller protein